MVQPSKVVGALAGDSERFVPLKLLGSGGFGVVYEAYDRQHDCAVALKVLNRIEPDVLLRFKNEFRSLAEIEHPNLAQLFELVAQQGQWFFSMELIDGVEFIEYVRWGVPQLTRGSDQRPPDFSRLRTATIQLVEGLLALHRAGKLHRDVKPQNVLVTPEGRVVLLDFGLIAQLSAEGEYWSSTVHGTPPYISPEQLCGKPVSTASDWYSVGAMLYEGVTGRSPFGGPVHDLLATKLSEEPTPPHLQYPFVPGELSLLCAQLMRRDPGERPTGQDIIRVLEQLQPEPVRLTPDRLTPVSTPPPKSPPLVGRTDHLEFLWDAVFETKQGQAVTVHVKGPSGIGKSALVNRFIDEVRREEQAVILSGRCYARESVPYKALDSLVDGLSQHLKQLAPYDALTLLPRNVDTLTRLFPVFRHLEKVIPAANRHRQISDQQELRRIAFAALRELLARIGDRGPLVLLIDDLQWGDLDSAVFLSELLLPPDPPALLLMLAYRSEEVELSPCLKFLRTFSAAQGRELDIRELPLAPLSETDARTLAASILDSGASAGEDAAQAVASEAKGHPYFVQELARHMSETPERPARLNWTASGVLSLDQVIWSRVSEFPDPARDLLEVVAVAASPLRPSQMVLAARCSDQGYAVLHRLVSAHLVRVTSGGPDAPIETYHDRIRDTVVAHMSRERLRSCHRRLAETFEASAMPVDAESLAAHFHSAENHPKAAHYYTSAAQQAVESLAFDHAARLYQFAVDLSGPHSQHGHTLSIQLGHALANAGRGTEAARVYLAAAKCCTDSAQALELERKAAQELLCSGHIDDGVAVLGDVLATVGMNVAPTPRRALWSMLVQRVKIRLRGLNFREQSEAQVSPQTLLRMDTCYSAAIGLSLVDNIRATDFLTRFISLALNTGELSRIALGLASEAAMSALPGGPARERSSRLLSNAEKWAMRAERPDLLGTIWVAKTMTAWLQGRWRECCETGQRAEELLRESLGGESWDLNTARVFYFAGLTMLGELNTHAERLPGLVRDADSRGNLYALVTVPLLGYAYVSWLAGDDPAAVRQRVIRTGRSWTQHGFHIQHFWELYALVDIHVYCGEFDHAWQMLEEKWRPITRSLLTRIQTLRIFANHLRARCALGMLNRGEAQPRQGRRFRRIARRCADRINREKVAWARPMSQVLLAAVALNRGDREGVSTLLDRALEGFVDGEMMLYATATRRVIGELIEGPRGAELIEVADQWMAGQGIANPRRMTAMLLPGLHEQVR